VIQDASTSSYEIFDPNIKPEPWPMIANHLATRIIFKSIRL